MEPKTLAMRADELALDLVNDPALHSAVLGNLIKSAKASKTPDEVMKIAASIKEDTGVTEEAALKMAWDTYTMYVNPEYGKAPTVKKGEKKAAAEPEPTVKTAAKVLSPAEELAEKLGAYGYMKPKKTAPKPKKKSAYKHAAARDLEEKLSSLGSNGK